MTACDGVEASKVRDQVILAASWKCDELVLGSGSFLLRRSIEIVRCHAWGVTLLFSHTVLYSL